MWPMHVFRRKLHRRAAYPLLHFPPTVTRLESRITPATASLSSGVLAIDYTTTGTTSESVTLNNDGINITLSGNVSGSLSNSAAAVSQIVVTDSGGGNGQTLKLNGSSAYSLSGGLTSMDVENVEFYCAVSVTGASELSITAPKQIGIYDTISTDSGALTLLANQQATNWLEAIDGIQAFGSVQSNSGDITIKGRAGWGDGLAGVYVLGSVGGTTGKVTVEGAVWSTWWSFNYGVRVHNAGKINSGGGDVYVTGFCGGIDDIGGSGNIGVLVIGHGEISAGGFGNVTVHGTGGIASGGNNYGVWVNRTLPGTSPKIASNGGDVIVTGVEGTGPGSVGIVLGDCTISSGGAGNISLISDTNSTDTTAAIVTANAVTFRQRTNGRAIDLGGDDVIGTYLGLTDAELDRITAGTLQIGDANAGAIKVSSAILRTAATHVNLVTGAVINLNQGLDSNGGNITLTSAGSITQTAGTVQTGAGTLTLAAASGQSAKFVTVGNQATSLVIPVGVTCLVTGSFDSVGFVQVDGTLGGNNGSVGTTTVTSTGTVAPGMSPGQLTTGNIAFNLSSTFSIELNGASPGVNYDQLIVNGKVNLGGATLSGTVGYAPPLSQVFKIIDNDALDAVVGTFNGISEGGIVTLGAYNFKVSYKGGDGNDVILTRVGSLPGVGGVTFGNGTNQRSTVRQMIVNFSEAVNFSPSVASAFTLHRKGNSVINGNPIGDVALTVTPAIGPATSVTITFSGSFTESNNSLIDGLYDFTIDASKVSGANGLLDGDFNGTAGGNYTVVGTTANRYYRLFGDHNGDGTVDQTDFNAFRLAFLAGPNTEFDVDNDGQVSQPDYNAFRLRFLGLP